MGHSEGKDANVRVEIEESKEEDVSEGLRRVVSSGRRRWIRVCKSRRCGNGLG